MAFSVPQFPLTCEVWNGPWLTKTLRISGVPCNLALGRRATWGNVAANLYEVYGSNANLLLPALTDVRDFACGIPADLIEVPSGSGRWYNAQMVDDVGKGFPNEYRFVNLSKCYQDCDGVGTFPGLYWPIPIP